MIIKRKKSAFTLVELLVVIAIIGILSTLAVVSLQNARTRARDAKRVADVRQMQTALELYFSEYNEYPGHVTPGGAIGIFMTRVPFGPLPSDGEGCVSADYRYEQIDEGQSYLIEFCLGKVVGSLEGGINCASPAGIFSSSSSCF